MEIKNNEVNEMKTFVSPAADSLSKLQKLNAILAIISASICIILGTISAVHNGSVTWLLAIAPVILILCYVAHIIFEVIIFRFREKNYLAEKNTSTNK